MPHHHANFPHTLEGWAEHMETLHGVTQDEPEDLHECKARHLELHGVPEED